MNRTAKIILGIIGGIIALCLLSVVAAFLLFRPVGTVLQGRMQADPGKASTIAGEIADFTLPDGFGSPYGTRLFGFAMVQYTHTDGHSHVSFFQVPRWINLDQAEMDRQFRQTDQGKPHNGKVQIKLVEQVEGSINGQAVTLLISEGANSDNEPYRECSAMFQGKGGQTMVVYEAPLSRWDQAEVDAFLASIH